MMWHRLRCFLNEKITKYIILFQLAIVMYYWIKAGKLNKNFSDVYHGDSK